MTHKLQWFKWIKKDWKQPDFTHWIEPYFIDWIQPKTVSKVYTYFNQISPIEFNLISPIEFNLISLVRSNQKRFAKSTRISTRFHPLNSTWFQRWFQHDFTGWIQLKTVFKIYTYFNQISMLDSTRFQSCVPAGMYFNQVSPIKFNLISALVSS